jgi:hypothetical protein
MTNQVINSNTKILDTTSAETGSDYTTTSNEQDLDKRALVHVEIGSGDTVILEGKLSTSASAYVTIETVTTSIIKEIKLPNILRARRSVDGGSADSKVWIQKLGSFNGQ